MASSADKETDGVGEELLDTLAAQLMMDEEWVVRAPGQLTWWGAASPLVISVSEPRMLFGDPAVKLTATWEVVPSAGVDYATACALASKLNASTTGAMTWVDPDSLAVNVTVTHYAHGGNRSVLDANVLSNLLLFSYSTARELHVYEEAFQATTRPRPHPVSDIRQDYDELLDFPDMCDQSIAHFAASVAGGSVQNHWADLGLSDSLAFFHREGLLATGSASAVTVEFPYTSDVPAAMAVGLGFAVGGERTALYQQDTTSIHPILDVGLSTTLRLPDLYTEAEAAVLANELNQAEAAEMTGFSGWGAWTASPPQPFPVDGSDLSHVLSSPSVSARGGLAPMLGWFAGLRTEWARERLNDGPYTDPGGVDAGALPRN